MIRILCAVFLLRALVPLGYMPSAVADGLPFVLCPDNLPAAFTAAIGSMKMRQEIDAMLDERPEDKILTFACNWCSYAGADYAGVSRLQYPPNARLIRTMCSGRVDEKFVWHAFEKGAPVVLVSGCHIGDCHYIDANHWTEKRIQKIHKKMEKMGIRPERLQLEWISAAEGQKFSRVMYELEEMRSKVTEEEVQETIKILEKESEKEKAKRAKRSVAKVAAVATI